MELPAHPDADDGDPQHRPAARVSVMTVVVVAAVTLLALIVLLHITGVVGPAG